MQGNDSFRLVVRRGPQPNQVYELNKDVVTLGRDITNDIVINDPEVSRHHMRLTRGAGSYTIEDLGSTNGTFINGQRLTGAKPLNNGDMVGLGETVTLAYEMGRGASSSPSPEGAPPTAAGSPYSSPSPQPSPPAPQPQSPSPYAPQSQAPSFAPSSSAAPSASSSSESQAPAGYSYDPPGSYPPQGPPDAGYDYDPYAAREEEPRSPLRWVLIGCAGLSLFCCCGTVVALVIIDQACLWESIPVLWPALESLGIQMVCT